MHFVKTHQNWKQKGELASCRGRLGVSEGEWGEEVAGQGRNEFRGQELLGGPGGMWRRSDGG